MPLKLFSPAEARPPVYELRLPIRIGAFDWARIGGAESVETSAAPAPAEALRSLRRETGLANAFGLSIAALPKLPSCIGGGRHTRRSLTWLARGISARLTGPSCRPMIECESRGRGST